MPDHDIVLLSHNAFWFQGHPFPTDAPEDPVPEIVEGLVRLYRSIEPDVVCLQEIQSEFAFRTMARALGMGGAYCPGGHFSQYGGATFWRRGKSLVDIRTMDRLPQRLWQICAVSLPELFPISVANVHLASARHLGEDGAAASRIRDLEQMLSQKVRPLIIAGDFNEAPGGGVADYLQAQGYIDTALLTQHPDISTGINKARSDQIWVQETLANQVAGFGILDQAQLGIDHADKELLSDHQPLWLRLTINHRA